VDPAPWEGGNPNRRRPLTGPDSLTGKGVSIAMKPENIKPHRSSGLYLRRVQAVMNRDGPYCHYCPAGPFTLEDFMAPDSKSAKASLDHKVPHSRGGPDGVPNRVIACCSCDTLKADTPYEEFVERMRSGGADA
jgi:5-methylcytosine-specific restriction endonuclease McrA